MKKTDRNQKKSCWSRNNFSWNQCVPASINESEWFNGE